MKHTGIINILPCLILMVFAEQICAQEYTSLPEPPREVPQFQQMTYYLTLSVNGQADQRLSTVLYKDGQYWVSAHDLVRNYIPVADSSQLVNISTLDQVSVKYVSTQQTLELTVPSDWLPKQYLDNQSNLDYFPAQSSTGLLLNYDSYFVANPTTKSYALNTWLEQRYFSPAGVLINTGVYRQLLKDNQDSNLEDGYLRYDTYWRNSNQKYLVSYQLGDFVSNALSWSNATRMGGVRVSRNFSVRPDLVTYPLFNYTGVASAPSSIDLFINGNKISNNNVNPGPFTLTNTPFINGAGEATVVTTDALGRQVATTLPFYVANTLLKKGLSDFDFSLGARRLNYGDKSFDYEHTPSFSGIYRYGLTNYMTVSSHVEWNKDLTLWGAGTDTRLGYWGVWSNAIAQSHSDQGTDYQYSTGYSYNSKKFNLNLQFLKRSSQFTDLSVLNTELSLSKQVFQGSFSFKPFGETYGSIGLGYFDILAQDNSRTRLANLSYSQRFWKNTSLTFSMNKIIGTSGFNSQLQLTIPLDHNRGTLSTSTIRDTEGKYAQQFLYTKPTPTDQGFGWNLGYSISDDQYRQAALTWKTQHFNLQGGLYGNNDATNYWAEFSGSLIYMDRSIFATNKVNDAFLVVNTSGFPDLPVYYDNRPVGRTDKNGQVLVPWVSAYYPAKLYVDTLNLPADVEALETETRIAVAEHKGAVIKFPIQKMRAANIKVVDQNQQALPVGTLIDIPEAKQSTIVGYDGWAYLTHLNQDNKLQIKLANGQQCEQDLHIQEGHINHATIQCPLSLSPPQGVP
ncbi:fimbria/pilus outer membrane usher protein [Acinetobacter sp. ME22]|uniref:fimbria/pilus outer membrane usher protein n=1 Tax=Acinetobacter sp. ME22 TaxID=2904802 RepID=UPI001EDA43FF|nr:fimbria/pilus outer membrane usher protein [Acinetobacter sp. ME22]MCG2574448.1 fimbria/pilus outer membrane usher protein [Acinetobacter sp. ME22]